MTCGLAGMAGSSGHVAAFDDAREVTGSVRASTRVVPLHAPSSVHGAGRLRGRWVLVWEDMRSSSAPLASVAAADAQTPGHPRVGVISGSRAPAAAATDQQPSALDAPKAGHRRRHRTPDSADERYLPSTGHRLGVKKPYGKRTGQSRAKKDHRYLRACSARPPWPPARDPQLQRHEERRC
jgi:hypothetical protein